jgi:hypothetical protein
MQGEVVSGGYSMRCVKLFEDLLSAERGFADRWYVTNGEEAVGPVNLDLLARGIESGKVPLDSFVRNEAWTVWRPLSDIAMVSMVASTTGAEPPKSGAAMLDGGTAVQQSPN